jgi:hypothetical protein
MFLVRSELNVYVIYVNDELKAKKDWKQAALWPVCVTMEAEPSMAVDRQHSVSAWPCVLVFILPAAMPNPSEKLATVK